MNHEVGRGRVASLVAGGMSFKEAIDATREERYEQINEIKSQIDRATQTLMPCPFCWGKAVITNALDGHGETISTEFRAQCEDCGCQLDNAAGSPSQAASEWNTRRRITAVVTYNDGTQQNCYGEYSAGDIANGLIHAADDHTCCKATLHAAANIIIQMEQALLELSQPLKRSDYTAAKLDEIVRGIAINALRITP